MVDHKGIEYPFVRQSGDDLVHQRADSTVGGALDYETSKRMAQSEDAATRAQVASREDVRPELLYYLAIDPAVEVRREVAANPAAPSQASAVLARDLTKAYAACWPANLPVSCPTCRRKPRASSFN